MKYEDLVVQTLQDLYGDLIQCQVPLNGGYADAVIRGSTRIIIEVKSTYNRDAYSQLKQYGRGEPSALCCVTKHNDLSVRTPVKPVYIQGLDTLLDLGVGYYVIPWSGRFTRRGPQPNGL